MDSFDSCRSVTERREATSPSNLESLSSDTSNGEVNEQGMEIFSNYGVILKNPNNRDDDPQCSGTLSVVQYSYGKCIEWKPAEVSVVSECQEQEWAMVNTVERRSRTLSGGAEGTAWRYQSVKIPLNELKGYRVSQKKTKLMLMQRDGTTHNAFFFQFGNADAFTNYLRSILKTKRSRQDRHYFVVIDSRPDPRSLPHSFSDLQILYDNPKETVWKFVNNLRDRPYETTLSTFSKFSEYLLYRNPETRPDEDVADLFNQRLMETPTAVIKSSVEEEGYHVVGRSALLPPRPVVCRGQPLSIQQWASATDDEGRISDVDSIKSIIFKGGVSPSLRYDVWKFLLGYYPWQSTNAERQDLRKQKIEDYFRMKLQWRSMTAEQESRFSDFRERKSLIEKDVNRTDRTVPFFSGENNPNLVLLYDILMTYVMYNFDLGYVQGMSDLLSPILSLMSNEADAFWCFVGFMDKVYRNFDMDQAGMKKQLSQLHTLLTAAGPDLSSYLDEHDSGNMFFCFRWLLVWFKREFSHDDIMTLWEVLWTGLPCSNFHLLVCVAILDTEKAIITDSNYGFTEILKHINDLSFKMNLEKLLCEAEAIYLQLENAPNLTMSTKRVLGLAPDVSPTSTSSDDDSIVDASPDKPESESFTDDFEQGFERAITTNYY